MCVCVYVFYRVEFWFILCMTGKWLDRENKSEKSFDKIMQKNNLMQFHTYL